MRVLVIEDNKSNQKLFRIILKYEGFEVIETDDGETGISIAKKEIPDIILMDIRLPIMNGIEAFQVLQADPVTQNIPVIAVTSYGMRGEKEKLLAIGFTAYIAKPISKQVLIDTIKEILQI